MTDRSGVLSKDLNPGQYYSGTVCRNPFSA